MTPEEKLDLALRSYRAFSAGPDVDALIPLYDPACEWTIGPRAVDTPAVYRGHDGLREFAAWFGEWVSSFRVTIEEARIATDGRLMIRHRVDLTSAVMAVEVSEVRWQEGDFTDRQILRVTELEQPPLGWDTGQVIGAAGLPDGGLGG
jgi:SnoaL-like domain